MVAPRILVVDNEPTTRQDLTGILASASCHAEYAVVGMEVLGNVQCQPRPDLVFLDLSDSNGAGLHILQQIHDRRPELAIVVFSAAGDTRQVVEAIRLGAMDYLNTPLQKAEVERVLLRCFGSKVSASLATDTADVVEELDEGVFFVAACGAMRKIRLQAEHLAKINVPVLILGESGTGKEVVAHLIHKLSSRSQRQFLKVNCAAFPSELLESELFGYERGTFNGAMRTKQGKLELCNGGTILLDEVAEAPSSLQAKLLRVLHDKQFFRLGGESTIDVDVRMLAATNVNVHQAIRERRLREDLYYRLSAFTIFLPPLRERQEEIPILLRHLIERTARQYALPQTPFSPALIEACLRYPWPGNLRELENFVKRYLVMGDEAMAMAELTSNWRQHQVVRKLPVADQSRAETASGNGEPHGSQFKSVLRTLKNETEMQAITRALEETHWNRKRAAGLLNISYRGLLYKIRQHGITRSTGTVLPPYLRERGIGS